MRQLCSYWALPLSGAVVEAMPLPMTATTAIIDSGGTAITVGVNDAATIHQVNMFFVSILELMLDPYMDSHKQLKHSSF